MSSSEMMLESIRMFFLSGITFSFALSTILVSVVLIAFFPNILKDSQKKTLRNLSIVFLFYVVYVIYVIISNGGVLPIY